MEFPLNSNILNSIIANCFVGISSYMFLRCPKLASCVVSIIPIVAAVNKKYGDWLHRNAALVQDALADANTASLEAISCVKTVFSFSSEAFEKERYNRAIDKLYRCSLQQVSNASSFTHRPNYFPI